MLSVLQYARSLREEDSREPGNAGVGTKGRRGCSQRRANRWFLEFVRDMGRFLHHHDQLLAGALGGGVGIGPAIFAHMIGILIVAEVVWLGTILGSEQGIAGP